MNKKMTAKEFKEILRKADINFNIMGFNGIIFGSVLYSFPVAFLMFIDAFNYVDNSIVLYPKVRSNSRGVKKQPFRFGKGCRKCLVSGRSWRTRWG